MAARDGAGAAEVTSLLVTVEGNVGAGKSTLLRALAEKHGAHVREEPLAAWAPWLERLYDGAYAGGALEFQLRVWLDRCGTAPAFARGAPLRVVERSPEFQKRVFLDGLTSSAAALLRELYERHTAWRPHAYVYLRTDPAACRARAQQRGRACEAGLSPPFFQALHDAHEAAAAALGDAVVAIDAEGKTPEALADEVWDRLCGDEARPLDWRAVERRLLEAGIYTQLAPWEEPPAWLLE